MGLIIGLIASFIGIGLLIIPFILNIYIDTRLKIGDTQDNIDKYRKWAKTSSILIIVAIIILLISVVMIWVYAMKKGEKKESLLETASNSVQSIVSLQQGLQTLKGGSVTVPVTESSSLGSAVSGAAGFAGKAKTFFTNVGGKVEEVGGEIVPIAEEAGTLATEIPIV